MYSIKAASSACGIPEETIRAWERRHGAVTPLRDGSNRRSYSDADVMRLRLLGQVVKLGHPISRVSGLGDRELKELVDSNDQALDRPPKVSAEIVNQFCLALKRYDVAECRRLLINVLSGTEPLEAVNTILSPLLNRVGEEWASGEISIAQEHLAVTIIKNLLMSRTETFQMLNLQKKRIIIFGTLSGQAHELGALIAAYLASSMGFICIYLGPSLPERELATAAISCKASVLAISNMDNNEPHKTAEQIARLIALLPKEMVLWIGGAVFDDQLRAKIPDSCVILNSFDDYCARLRLYQMTQ